jgi:5-methylthioadenosine/S-adenosylhomocysteine deaminase
MPKRVLLRGGHVLSMDPEIGDVYGGDVLLEDDRIAAVGPSLDTGDADIVDASSCIVMPGFIDSHRHTWETVIRGIAPDVSLAGYFDVVLDQLAPAYRPEDVYAGNFLGSLEAIDAGVTTVLDWSHINNTPEHADEAIRGLRDARLRSVYCYGNPTRRSPTGGTRAR